MNGHAKLDIVRSSPLAVDLTDEQCRILAGVIETRHLVDGEILLEEGGFDHSLYVIMRGNVAVTKAVGGGDAEVLHILKAGELAGALGFVDGQEHTATLRSLGSSEVFILERNNFESLVQSQPQMVYQVMRAIIRTVHAIVRRMNTQYVELTNYVSKQHGRY